MANTTHPKSSGLDDVDAVLENINTKEELIQDTGKLNQYLEHVHGAVFRAEKVMKEADSKIERLESVTKSVEKSAELIDPALKTLVDHYEKDTPFHFTARLNDKSTEQIKQMHREFKEDEKEFLKKHIKAEKNMIATFEESQTTAHTQFMTNMQQAFESHEKEMEKIQRYGQGVWLNKRTWQWVIGLLIALGWWFVASITLWIIKAA
jgi:hypothetical protein